MSSTAKPRVAFSTATGDRWEDLERLFGPRGASAGCWCMWWRRTSKEFESGKGDGNRRDLRALVESEPPPGLLAYVDGIPAAWCAVGPMASFPRLVRARFSGGDSADGTWAAPCLFVARPRRRQGLSVELLVAAADFACSHGARELVGYPIEPRSETMPDAFAWTGVRRSFERAAFIETARHTAARPVMARRFQFG
jgi:GNAT superfamily N-acetyltransferase